MNPRTRTWLSAGLALSLAGCMGDGNPESVVSPDWVPPIQAFSPLVPNGIDLDIGLEEVFDIYHNGPLLCTADDTNLFATFLSPEQDAPTCFENEILNGIQIVADVVSTANERFDISFYLARDRGPEDDPSARIGPTTFYWLEGELTTDAFTTGIRGPNTNVGANGQDFFDGDGDACGDIEQDVVTRSGPITLNNLVCRDSDGNGSLDVGSCVAYDNNTNNACSDATGLDEFGIPIVVANTHPNTGSKCKCGPLTIPITVLKSGTLEVVKEVLPNTYEGDDFELFIDRDATAEQGPQLVEYSSGAVGHGGSTGPQMVYAGTQSEPGADHTVEEIFLNGVEADGFVTSISCVDRDLTTFDGGTPLTQAGVGPLTVPVDPDDDIVCTITNEAKSNIIVVKETEGGDGTFSFTSNTLPDASFDITTSGNTEQEAFNDLIPGDYDVSEVDPTPDWDLISATCDNGDDPDDIELGPGETVTCTFVNRERGDIVVVKETIGGDGTFGFTSGTLPDAAFDITTTGNTGQATFNDLVPGPYDVSEDDPTPDWDLVTATCDNGDDPDDITLGAGETVTCTFVNTERAMVTVEKTVNGGPTILTFPFTLDGPEVDENAEVPPTTDFNGAKLIIGETYTVCEVELPAGWTASWTLDGQPVTPYNPNENDAPPEDLGTRCYDFTPTSPDDAGRTFAFVIDNVQPPDGDTRTIGYWKNWSTCSGGKQQYTAQKNGGPAEGFWLIDDVLPLSLGGWVVASCEDAVSILDKRELSGKKKASDAAYALAAQLLAAKANTANPGPNAGCRPADFDQKVVDADALLSGIGFDGMGNYLRPKDAEYGSAVELAEFFDMYNNGDFCNGS